MGVYGGLDPFGTWSLATDLKPRDVFWFRTITSLGYTHEGQNYLKRSRDEYSMYLFLINI